MIGYVTIGTSNMEKAKAYWGDLLSPLGAKVFYDMGRIAMIGTGMDKPFMAVCVPYDEKDPSPGNGNMISFPVATRDQVDELYAKALALGGTDEGAPGERGPTFYGGYFRDPDGNKALFYKMG